MRMTVIVEFADDGSRATRRRAVAVTRDPAQAASGDIGLTLAEGKQLLEYVQHEVVAAQADDLVERARICERCGHRLKTKTSNGAGSIRCSGGFRSPRVDCLRAVERIEAPSVLAALRLAQPVLQ